MLTRAADNGHELGLGHVLKHDTVVEDRVVGYHAEGLKEGKKKEETPYRKHIQNNVKKNTNRGLLPFLSWLCCSKLLEKVRPTMPSVHSKSSQQLSTCLPHSRSRASFS